MDIGLDWQKLVLWATGLSLLTLIATAIAVPWVVTRLPRNYFSRAERTTWRDSAEVSLLSVVLRVAKNLVGGVLALLGLVMLVTPGQGVLTLLAGLLLMNFPGKYRLERWLVMRPGILRALNWLRHRRDQPPFDAPIATE